MAEWPRVIEWEQGNYRPVGVKPPMGMVMVVPAEWWEKCKQELDQQRKINEFDLAIPIAEMRGKMEAQDSLVERRTDLARQLYEALREAAGMLRDWSGNEARPDSSLARALARCERELCTCEATGDSWPDDLDEDERCPIHGYEREVGLREGVDSPAPSQVRSPTGSHPGAGGETGSPSGPLSESSPGQSLWGLPVRVDPSLKPGEYRIEAGCVCGEPDTPGVHRHDGPCYE